LEVGKQVQAEEPIPVGKDFCPRLGDFGHMAFVVAPIMGYLGHSEHFDLEYLETV